jgi:hypothetical protein
MQLQLDSQNLPLRHLPEKTKQNHENEFCKAYQHQSVAKRVLTSTAIQRSTRAKAFLESNSAADHFSSSHWIHTKNSAKESLQKELLNALWNVFIRPEMLEI